MSEPNQKSRGLMAVIFALAWPAMLEQALQTIVMYVDAAMVGRLGVQATAAVGLTTTVSWLLTSPLWSLGIGVLACIAKGVGAKDEHTVRTAAMQTIWLSLIVGGILTVITQSIAPVLPVWLGAEAEIRREGSLYFAIVCAPLVFRSLSYFMGSALRASGDTRTPMLVNLAMNCINVLLNLLLIFPTREVSVAGLVFTMPGAGWGVIGAAIATAISVTFSGTMMLMKVLSSPTLSIKGMPLRWDGPVMLQCVRVGLPIAVQNLGVYSGHVVFSAQVTSLGKVALATHSIALTAEEAFYIPAYGLETAISTLCGNALGERNERKLDRVSRTVLLLSMGMMTVTGAILFAFPSAIMSFFTADAQVIAGGAVVLRIVACSEPLYAAMIMFEGVFHGVGQTKYPFCVALFTMWGVRILSTLLCVRVLGLGLPAVWLCMVADNVARAALLGARYSRGRWKNTLDLNRT